MLRQRMRNLRILSRKNLFVAARAEGRAKEAAQAEASAQKAQKALADDYAKAAANAEPALRKLRAAAGVPEAK